MLVFFSFFFEPFPYKETFSTHIFEIIDWNEANQYELRHVFSWRAETVECKSCEGDASFDMCDLQRKQGFLIIISYYFLLFLIIISYETVDLECKSCEGDAYFDMCNLQRKQGCLKGFLYFNSAVWNSFIWWQIRFLELELRF